MAGGKLAGGALWGWLALAVLILTGWLPGLSSADESPDGLSDEQAIESAKDSLAGRSRFPFYDRQKDNVRQLAVEPPTDNDSANRKTKWTGKNAAPRTTTAAPGFGFAGLGWALQALGLTVLVVLIVVLAVLIVMAFLKTEITETRGSKLVETSHDVDKVQALPFQLRKPTGDFLAEARRLYEAGNFSEAVIYLYSHLLVLLDRHHVIRLAKGKTNRQYLRETRTRPLLREILDRTMIAFEDVFFGHHELPRERFEECWQRVDEFHAELEKLERAAA